MREFRNHGDDVIGWWATHILNGGCDKCPSTTSPEVAEKVIAEWKRRGKPNGRPTKEKRGTT